MILKPSGGFFCIGSLFAQKFLSLPRHGFEKVRDATRFDRPTCFVAEEARWKASSLAKPSLVCLEPFGTY
jgi:hypothetical protein